METLKFKTNIKCMGCVTKATPFLNEVAGEDNWMVDVNSPDKVLTVMTEKNIDANDIETAVKEAGFEVKERI